MRKELKARQKLIDRDVFQICQWINDIHSGKLGLEKKPSLVERIEQTRIKVDDVLSSLYK